MISVDSVKIFQTYPRECAAWVGRRWAILGVGLHRLARGR